MACVRPEGWLCISGLSSLPYVASRKTSGEAKNIEKARCLKQSFSSQPSGRLTLLYDLSHDSSLQEACPDFPTHIWVRWPSSVASYLSLEHHTAQSAGVCEHTSLPKEWKCPEGQDSLLACSRACLAQRRHSVASGCVKK